MDTMERAQDCKRFGDAPTLRRVSMRVVIGRLALLLAVLVSPLAGSATPSNPHGVAVIIGNRTYGTSARPGTHCIDDGGIPAVEFAHRDAEAFRRYVIDVLGYDPENIIDLRDATQARMWSTFGSRQTADRGPRAH